MPIAALRSAMRRTSIALGAAGLLVSRSAQAGAPLATMRLSWIRSQGAESCLDEKELASRVAARLGRAPFSPDAPLELKGTIERAGEHFRVEIGVRDEAGSAVGRRVIEADGPDCTPVGDAVVLAVALTIDPDARLEEASPEAPAPAPRTVAASPPSSTPAVPLLSALPHSRDTRGTPMAIDAVARAVLALGALPGPAPGAELVAFAGRGRLRGTLGVTFFPERSADDPRIALGLTFLTAGVCYDPVAGRVARLRLCSGVQVGAIHSVAKAVNPINPGERAWLGAEFGPRCVWKELAPLTLEIGVSAVVPFFRRDFRLVGEYPSYRQSQVGLMAAVGAGFGVF